MTRTALEQQLLESIALAIAQRHQRGELTYAQMLREVLEALHPDRCQFNAHCRETGTFYCEACGKRTCLEHKAECYMGDPIICARCGGEVEDDQRELYPYPDDMGDGLRRGPGELS